jgi:hypothetical protein
VERERDRIGGKRLGFELEENEWTGKEAVFAAFLGK